MLAKLLSKDKCEAALELLEQLNISNDVFKEHLMDLCTNPKIIELFDKLSNKQCNKYAAKCLNLRSPPDSPLCRDLVQAPGTRYRGLAPGA